VSGLARVDTALEKAAFLPELKPAEVAPEVAGPDGGMSEECKQVSEVWRGAGAGGC
jgi:hypothetical protein